MRKPQDIMKMKAAVQKLKLVCTTLESLGMERSSSSCFWLLVVVVSVAQ